MASWFSSSICCSLADDFTLVFDGPPKKFMLPKNDLKYNNEPCQEKTCLMPYANNKSADQPAHQHSLIGPFAVHCLDSIMSILAKYKISKLWLTSVAEQASLSLNKPSPKLPKT